MNSLLIVLAGIAAVDHALAFAALLFAKRMMRTPAGALATLVGAAGVLAPGKEQTPAPTPSGPDLSMFTAPGDQP